MPVLFSGDQQDPSPELPAAIHNHQQRQIKQTSSMVSLTCEISYPNGIKVKVNGISDLESEKEQTIKKLLRQVEMLQRKIWENALRSIGLEKNCIFCGNHDAAENAAIIYSMMGCCKAHQVNFREWMVFFLNKVHYYDNDYSKDLAELLPHNFKKSQSGPI